MKKREFHCYSCHNPCMIFKKGKHRVLVCPHCGILATNPLPLIPIIASLLPSVIGAVAGGGKGKKGTPQEEGTSKKIVYDSLDKPNKGERYVKMALGD